MDKRYQVFVSSTYNDLKDERSKVIQGLLRMDVIPAGMEFFSAADVEQFEYIKREIDVSDYYLLIIGARYGSITADGVSFTEKEYDYAVESRKEVIALLHESPEKLPANKSDLDPELRRKLGIFREKAKEGRIVDYWTSAEALPGLVLLSLHKAIKMSPATGWIRADRAGSEDLLNDINGLRKENKELREENQELRAAAKAALKVSDLARPEEPYKISFLKRSGLKNSGSLHPEYDFEPVPISITWAEVFSLSISSDESGQSGSSRKRTLVVTN